MLKVVYFAIGNNLESFCLDSFKDGINILASDDNNKGKTIIFQGIMYALGNVPIMPKGFENYVDYYFIVHLSDGKTIYKICRKSNSFIVNDGTLNVFQSVSEFKRYFLNHFNELPSIFKNNILSPAGLELFYELLFLPQDKRNTSNLINKGMYNKEDLLELVYLLANCKPETFSGDIEALQEKIKGLEKDRKKLVKENDFIKSETFESSIITYTNSKKVIDEKIQSIEKMKKTISEYTKELNRVLNKKTQNQILLEQINSLNRSLDEGKFVCLDCNSTNIGFESKDIKFEIADSDMRSKIRDVIKDRININNEEIIAISAKLNEKKQELANLLVDDDINLENILLYKQEIKTAQEIDEKIKMIDVEIDEEQRKLDSKNKMLNQFTADRATIDEKIVNYMNEFYHYADDKDPLVIDSPFTKQNINYSGSQGSLFLMSRIYAFAKILNLNLPILIDHFRGAELSSFKEEKVLQKFNELSKQVLLSCTLKKEEMNKFKNGIYNFIDLSFATEHKLMNSSYNNRFIELMSEFSIKL